MSAFFNGALAGLVLAFVILIIGVIDRRIGETALVFCVVALIAFLVTRIFVGLFA